jgi:hypothetical protein
VTLKLSRVRVRHRLTGVSQFGVRRHAGHQYDCGRKYMLITRHRQLVNRVTQDARLAGSIQFVT